MPPPSNALHTQTTWQLAFVTSGSLSFTVEINAHFRHAFKCQLLWFCIWFHCLLWMRHAKRQPKRYGDTPTCDTNTQCKRICISSTQQMAIEYIYLCQPPPPPHHPIPMAIQMEMGNPKSEFIFRKIRLKLNELYYICRHPQSPIASIHHGPGIEYILFIFLLLFMIIRHFVSARSARWCAVSHDNKWQPRCAIE